MFRKAVTTAGAVAPPPKPSFLDVATLRLHALAVSRDWTPSEFGDAEPVDETDPRALRREWLRQYRIWADSSPEQLFAIKIGAILLGAPLIVLLVFIAAM